MKNVVIVVDEKKCKEIEKFYSIYAKENKNEYILFFAKKEPANMRTLFKIILSVQ